MTVYESLMFAIGFCSLVVTIIFHILDHIKKK